MSLPDTNRPITLDLAILIVGFLAVAPLLFPLEWLFHLFPDKYPVIHRMRGLGVTPKILWVLCGPLAIATMLLLRRRPFIGLALCALLAAIYIPTAMVLWGRFSLGCWAAIAAVTVAGVGAATSSRASYSSMRTRVPPPLN